MIVTIIGMMILAYLLGAIPFGYLIVKLSTGEDIRKIQSGRTGGTNTMRAAGFWAGLSTAALDIAKGAGAVVIARQLTPFADPWLLVTIPLIVIIGNNYSVFMLGKSDQGRLKFGGGAGGAACLGGSLGLWWPSAIIILLVGIGIFYFVGYASVTTMSIALTSTLIFSMLSIYSDAPWAYALYGILAESLLIISLRPNIQRLKEGTERLHGLRAKKAKQATSHSH